MTIKGRSTAMRHITRTHRVNLDWLYERFLYDSHFLIRYIDTKFQIADILTKGSFTIDQWKILLKYCSITSPSTPCGGNKRNQSLQGAHLAIDETKMKMIVAFSCSRSYEAVSGAARCVPGAP